MNRRTRRSRAVWIAVPVVFVAGAAACSDAPPVTAETGAVLVRDSAGIEIVESQGPVEPLGSWTLDSEPTTLCSGGGPVGDDRVFRIRSIVPLGPGRAAVLVWHTPQVLICDGGRVARTLGRAGEGPGELGRNLRGMVPGAGDSVIVVEAAKLTVFSTSTGGARDVPVRQIGAEGVLGVYPAPDLAVGVRPIADGADNTARGPSDLLYLGPTATPTRVFRNVPWETSGPVLMATWLWGAAPRPVLGNDGYWIPTPGAFELRRYEGLGVDRIVRAAWGHRPMTEAYREEASDAALANLLENNSSGPNLLRPMVEGWEREDTTTVLPPILEVLPSTEGGLWIRIPEETPGVDPLLWRVFGSDGRWLSEVSVPPNTRLVRAHEDRVYAVTIDDLGLESVVEIRLRR